MAIHRRSFSNCHVETSFDAVVKASKLRAAAYAARLAGPERSVGLAVRGKTMKQTPELLEAVQLYFDALYFCDVEILNKVFHETSSLFDADEGEIFVEPIASFSADVGGRTSPASKKSETRRRDIDDRYAVANQRHGKNSFAGAREYFC